VDGWFIVQVRDKRTCTAFSSNTGVISQNFSGAPLRNSIVFFWRR
jgi:hypothetical protein